MAETTGDDGQGSGQPATVFADALPLVVAVTGHRDLVADERDQARERVRAFFEELAAQVPARRLRLLSSLAEGADQLVAEVALELNIDLVVPLPMEEADYLEDFTRDEDVSKYRALKSQASEVYVLKSASDHSLETTEGDWSPRQRDYARLGIFLAAHCHVLLALWDGKHSDQPGGTGHVVKFHHDDVAPGFVPKSITTQQMLIDDESDLIYHIVVSRDRENGAPRGDLEPLDSFWFTKDRNEPVSKTLPQQHRNIFQRSGEFSADALRFATEIERERYPLIDTDSRDQLPPGLYAIERWHSAADWLAIRYQRLMLSTYRLIHAFAFTMGLMFIFYTDLATRPYYLAVFLLAFGLASVVQFYSKRRGWHRKYLDYRALAEGLRIQFYWAAAGVSQLNPSRFTHDSFLQAQDPEIGWIRNVMRVAGTRVNATPSATADGLDFAIREWIGTETSGQLGYFRSRTRVRYNQKKLTDRIGIACLAASAAVVTAFLFAGSVIPEIWRDPMMVSLGVLLLIFAVRHSYTSSIAETELIKQYEFMLRVYDNSYQRIQTATDDTEKRQVLYALGQTALDEQAQWLLTHRERSIESTDILQMGG